MISDQPNDPAPIELLDNWTTDTGNAKFFFRQFYQQLAAKPRVALEWVNRPGISYSLRGNVGGQTHYPLFVMIDIIDDDPQSRWLSVCFYGDMIDDPDELGDFVPGGLLGQDGHCFDLDENDPVLFAYIGARIDQAYRYLLDRS